jgi:hypothetical protein
VASGVVVALAVPGATLGFLRAQAAKAAAIAAAARAPMTIPAIWPGERPPPTIAGQSVVLNTLEQLVTVTLRGSNVHESSVQLLLSLQLGPSRAWQKGPDCPAPVPSWQTAGKQPFEGQLKPTQEQPGSDSTYVYRHTPAEHESTVQGLRSLQTTGWTMHFASTLSTLTQTLGKHKSELGMQGGTHREDGVVVETVEVGTVTGTIVMVGTTMVAVVTGTVVTGTVVTGTMVAVVTGTMVAVVTVGTVIVVSSHLTC